MPGFYVRGLPAERYEQLREQARRDVRDLRDEAAILIAEALEARQRDQRPPRAERRLVAAS